MSGRLLLKHQLSLQVVVMRSIITVPSILILLTSLGACDPGYTIGARTQVAPTTTDSCLVAAMRDSSQHRDLRFTDGKQGPLWPVLMYDSAARIWRHASLRVGPVTDSILPVQLTTSWIGNAQSVPLSHQRRFTAAAASELERISMVCARSSSARIECVATGGGGHPACTGTL